MPDATEPADEELRQLVQLLQDHDATSSAYQLEDLAADLQAVGATASRDQLVRQLTDYDPPTYLAAAVRAVLIVVRASGCRPINHSPQHHHLLHHSGDRLSTHHIIRRGRLQH